MLNRLLTQRGLCCVLVCAGTGCATIEFSKPPRVPDVVVTKPLEDANQHVSPPALDPAKVPPADDAAPVPGEALNLTVEGAIVIALANNKALAVEEVNPAIQRTFVSEQRSVFDPVLNAAYVETDDENERDLLLRTPITIPDGQGGTITAGSAWQPVETEVETDSESRSVGVTQRLPTGTDITLTYGKDRTVVRNKSTDPRRVYGTDTDTDTHSLDFTVRQQLLRGGGLGVNLASLRQAKLAALASEYNLRGFTEDLVSQVEQTYWDCLTAQRQIKIFEDSLTIAENQAKEIGYRIEIGGMAESESAAADAEVAQRKSSLIDAKSNYDTLRIALLRLLNPNAESLHPVELNLLSDPKIPEVELIDISASIALARRMRPDLNQTRLQIQQDDLEVVRTRNGLLPQLDVFVTLSKSENKTHYSELFLVNTQVEDDDNVTTQIGAEFSYPFGNRGPRARYIRSTMTRSRNLLALANLNQLVEQDIRTAHIEVDRAKQQIEATAVTSRLQQTTLDVEREKLRQGKSTVLLVSQAQRDLLTAQINEVQAIAAYLKALVNLYRLEGSLLERRGVACPGSEPIDLASEDESLATASAGATTPAPVSKTEGALPQ
ncbi:MAG: TolC family protein [Candidatus Hydrogenedentes bacterium]|nr:TolC family protein [Candidatus Hydrogenedentota bacterium]